MKKETQEELIKRLVELNKAIKYVDMLNKNLDDAKQKVKGQIKEIKKIRDTG